MRTKITIGLLTVAAVLVGAGTTMGVSFEQAFDPPSGRGPIVLVLSGAGERGDVGSKVTSHEKNVVSEPTSPT